MKGFASAFAGIGIIAMGGLSIAVGLLLLAPWLELWGWWQSHSLGWQVFIVGIVLALMGMIVLLMTPESEPASITATPLDRNRTPQGRGSAVGYRPPNWPPTLNQLHIPQSDMEQAWREKLEREGRNDPECVTERDLLQAWREKAQRESELNALPYLTLEALAETRLKFPDSAFQLAVDEEEEKRHKMEKFNAALAWKGPVGPPRVEDLPRFDVSPEALDEAREKLQQERQDDPEKVVFPYQPRKPWDGTDTLGRRLLGQHDVAHNERPAGAAGGRLYTHQSAAPGRDRDRGLVWRVRGKAPGGQRVKYTSEAKGG